MPVTVVATAKGTTSNSYVTLAEAEAYMLGRADPGTWTAAAPTDDIKNRALVTATNRLEQQDYNGSPTVTAQRLKWPRSGTSDADGRSYSQDTVPRVVKEATYELALAIVNGELELKDTGLEGFNSAKVGPLAVDINHGHDAGSLPRQVRRLLVDVMLGAGALTVRVARA